MVGSDLGVGEDMLYLKPLARDNWDVRDLLRHITPTPVQPNNLSDEQKINLIADKFTEILKVLGLNLHDDSLKDTPQRVARMYVREIFSGLNPAHFPKISVIENKMKYEEPVLVKNIALISTCEHHFVTIAGRAHVAYVPAKKIIGLSKINRLVRFFARQPQVQERLTRQIADALQLVLETDHVAVRIDADHFCVRQRGVEDTESTTITFDYRGRFKTDSALIGRLGL